MYLDSNLILPTPLSDDKIPKQINTTQHWSTVLQAPAKVNKKRFDKNPISHSKWVSQEPVCTGTTVFLSECKTLSYCLHARSLAFQHPKHIVLWGKQCRFCLFRLVFWVHSFDFWVMLMLQYSHLSPNVWGTSASTTLKMRKENYSSWMCVDMYMKQKNIPQMQNSSWSSFYIWQHWWYGTLTILLWVNFFPDQHWNICNVQMNEKKSPSNFSTAVLYWC